MNSAQGLYGPTMMTASGSPLRMVSSAPFTATVLRSKVPSDDQLHAALLQRLLHAGEAGAAEAVILVENGDPRDVAVLGQPLDHRLGLLEVGGADVDDVGLERLAQELGAGERRR